MTVKPGDVVADLHGVRHVVEGTLWGGHNTRPVTWCERWWDSRNLGAAPVAGPPTCFWCAAAGRR